MTKQESFKRRVRDRMAKTGERYGAARRMLLTGGDPAAAHTAGRSAQLVARPRASEPEMSDAAIQAGTGRTWDEWCNLIDARLGPDPAARTHRALVQVAQAEGLDSWWAQGVAVSYERIAGLRLPGQRADGSFEVSATRTVRLAVDLRALLLDDDGRRELFGGLESTMRSRPTSKSLRIGLPEGSLLVTLTSLPDGRTRVNVAHGGLPTQQDAARWKDFWADWLAAVAAG